MQAEMHATASDSGLAQKASQAAAANQEIYEQLQYQQQQQRQVHDGALRHWPSTEPDSLPGAAAEDLATAQTEPSHLHHASARHLSVQKTGSGIPMLLGDIAEPAAAAQQTGLHLSSELLQQLQGGYMHGGAQAQSALAADAQQKLHHLPAGIAALRSSSLEHAAASRKEEQTYLQHRQQHGQLDQSPELQKHVHSQVQLQQYSPKAASPLAALQKHAASVPQAVSPLLQAQVLRHRKQPDLLKEKKKGIRGILSFAHLASSRVAPDNAPQGVSSLSNNAMLPRTAEGTEDKSTLSSRLSSIGSIHTIKNLKIGVHGKPKIERSPKYRKPKLLLMRVALQQSVQQVKACTLHFEEQKLQQQVMQETLQIMTTNCGIIFDHVLQTQQQRTGR